MPERLNFFLSGFDCVILANVPRESFTAEQDAALRTCVHEQGCGLIMIGGRSSFGGGGWQNTEVEKALPVTCDFKSLKVEGRSVWCSSCTLRKSPKATPGKRKSPSSPSKNCLPTTCWECSITTGTGRITTWHIPFQTVGEDKERDACPGGHYAPRRYARCRAVLEEGLRRPHAIPQHNLGTKHIIFISDGDHWRPRWLAQKIQGRRHHRDHRVHHFAWPGRIQEHEQMVARSNRRRASIRRRTPTGNYTSLDPQQLPQIYMKETRLISKSFIYNKKFFPQLYLRRPDPTEGLPGSSCRRSMDSSAPRPAAARWCNCRSCRPSWATVPGRFWPTGNMAWARASRSPAMR